MKTFPTGAIVLPRERVLAEVRKERLRQDEKWGEQNHPNGTGPLERILKQTDVNLDLRLGDELARIFRRKCDNQAHANAVTWRDSFLEEAFEALAEDDPARLREELIQVAAVAQAWVEAIDRSVEK